ncbi:hypothetical protein [Streptococcus dentiloxodontae]
MNFLTSIYIIFAILFIWAGIGYLVFLAGKSLLKSRLASRPLTRKQLLTEYYAAAAFPAVFFYFGGPIGFYLAKKKFVSEWKAVIEKKMDKEGIKY